MRLVIDCRFIGKSGIGTYIENILNELLLHHPEHEYLLISEKRYPQYDSFSNVDYVLTDIKPFSLKELFLFPTKKINRYDAFFSPYINIPMGIKIPVYCTIHDVIFWDMPELVSRVGLWIRTFFIKHAINASRAIFTVSNFSKKRIIHHFKTEIPIYVVPNGVARFIRDFTDVVDKQDYILFVGNVKEHKGLHVLIEAYRKAKAKGFPGKLVIVGDYRHFRTTDDVIQNSSKGDIGIKFTGRLNNKDLLRTIASARLLVLPSMYEGFGIPPMEALYLGTDTIISDIPALKEIYGKLPVTFFHVNDVDDLADKLITYKPNTESKAVTRKMIMESYSFRKAADSILALIAGIKS